MEYIADIYVGSSDLDSTFVKSLNSSDYEGSSGNNAYDSARKFAFEQLDNSDFAKIHFTGEPLNSSNDIWLGAFTHPVRGRCKFSCLAKDFESHKREVVERANTPIYSANQLYAMKPVKVNTEDVIANLIEHWLKEELNLEFILYSDSWSEFKQQVESEKRIEIRYLANVGLGSDESWVLATLWYQSRPLAVLTYQGEDWDYEAYISSPNLLREMSEWLYSLAPKPIPGVIDADVPNESYTEFWGHTIHDFYDVELGVSKQSKHKNSWVNYTG